VAPLVELGVERAYAEPVAALLPESLPPSSAPHAPVLSSLGSVDSLLCWALWGLASGWIGKESDLEAVFEFNGLDMARFLDSVANLVPQSPAPIVFLSRSGRPIPFP
jgi:hypothetical protein